MVKRKVTQAVIEANRANAKKSTGPRTAAGTRLSKRNAITHGIFSQELVLNGDDRQQLEAIRTRLYSELCPETASEVSRVEKIAANIGRWMACFRRESTNTT